MNKKKKLFIIRKSQTIRKQLFIIYFMLILIPLSIFTFITYYRVSQVIYEQTMTSASQSFKECVTDLERYWRDMNTIMINLLDSPEVYRLASLDPLEYYKQEKGANSVIIFMRYLKNTTGIANISLYSKYNLYSAEQIKSDYMSGDLINLKWEQILKENNLNRMWISQKEGDSPSESDVLFSYIGRIYEVEDINQELAIAKIDLSRKSVLTIMENTAFTPNSITYIYDGKDVAISNTKLPDTQAWRNFNLSLAQSPKEQWIKAKIDDLKVVYRVHGNRMTGWSVVSIVPMKDITSVGDHLRVEMLGVMVGISIVSYLLALFISNSSIRRLSNLTKRMKEVEEGNVNVSIKDNGQDEISELIHGFNGMVDKISILVEEQYQIGLEVKSLEIKALQSQINPHFLYNSLDLINCLSIQYDIKEIGQMVSALSKFYKLSLSNGNDIIKISDEVSHVSVYVSIQNLRYDQCIHFTTDIDEAIKNYKIPKIILQPIVENAVIHGIFGKAEKFGQISITGTLKENLIYLTVKDNGVGMSEEQCKKMLIQDNSNAKNGYGAYNTHMRLQLYFGNDYGLTYQSKIGEGTTVIVKIPIEE